MTDTVRYVLAVAVVAAFPGAILGWLVIHGFVATWRRLGLAASYLAFIGLIALPACVVYLARAVLFAVEFGANAWTISAAAACYGMAAFIEIRCRKHLSFKTLIGLPELSPDLQAQRLLQDGIYGRVRHPRYLGLMFGILAVALFTNYLAAYVLFPVACVGFYLVTILEERELAERFGEAYKQYQLRVPRLIPRWRAVPRRLR